MSVIALEHGGSQKEACLVEACNMILFLHPRWNLINHVTSYDQGLYFLKSKEPGYEVVTVTALAKLLLTVSKV